MTTRESGVIDGRYVYFEEVHPEFYNYFVLAEPAAVERFRTENGLPADLLSEFTTSDFGDAIVKQGVLIPMASIGPDYYDIVFSNAKHPALLSMDDNRIALTADGYVVNVVDGCLRLFSLHYLKNYGPHAVESIETLSHEYNQPRHELAPGRYALTILGGHRGEYRTPTYEFRFRADPDAAFSGNVNFDFNLDEVADSSPATATSPTA